MPITLPQHSIAALRAHLLQVQQRVDEQRLDEFGETSRIADLQLLLTAATDLMHERERLLEVVRETAMNNDVSISRASGRTTRMLLRGLIALSAGQRVMIVATTSGHGRALAERLIEMARREGVPIPQTSEVIGRGARESRIGFHGVVLFDHTVVGDVATNVAVLK